MKKIQQIRCPNCGSHAQREYSHQHHMTHTTCPTCDYLMINCSLTGRVVEFYAPGINSTS